MKNLLAFFLSLFIISCSNSESARPIEQVSSNEGEESPGIDSGAAHVEIEGMVYLESGSVSIGSNDNSFKANERPSMKVQLDYDFYMGVHEVTCSEYAKVAAKSSIKTFGKCDNDSLPLVDITFYDAVLYANAKSKLDGHDSAYTYSKAIYDSDGHCTNLEGFAFHADAKAFRLPTEAEWVYAATRAWDTKKSRNNANSEYKLHSVCSKGADSAGFCDMAGNAMEWVNDWLGLFRDTTVTNYAGAPDGGDMGERVVKGGCFSSAENELNPYSRGDVYTVTSSTRAEYVGFRLAFGSIPGALWMNADGIMQTSVITPLAGNETIKAIAGTYNIKLAFRNDVSGNIAYIDYLNGSLSVKEITKDINAYHPEISPDGQWIAFCTGLEGISGKSTLYVQNLKEENVPIKLDVDNAAIPRWRVLDSGDTVIIYVSDAGNNKDESWKSQSTWQVNFASGKFGTPQKLFDGAYHGGISEDRTLAVSGAKILRARIANHDTIWYDSAQACNVSLSQDGTKRTAFLDFAGTPGQKFAGESYTIHERLFIADSTGKLIQSIRSPSGYTFDHTEWASDGVTTLIVATLANTNEAHTQIVIINPADNSITPIVAGNELWHPNLWIKRQTPMQDPHNILQSSSSSTCDSTSSSSSTPQSGTSTESNFILDPDSAGMYYNASGVQAYAYEWRYKMEFLWTYKDTANVVITGSSRVHFGVNPQLFNSPYFAVNLSVEAMPHQAAHLFLTKYILPHMKKLKVVIKDLDIDRWYEVSPGIFGTAYKSYPGYVYDENHNYWKDGVPEGLAKATFDSPGISTWQEDLRSGRGFYPLIARGWGNPTADIDSNWFDYLEDKFDQNFNILVQMIEECQEKNIFFIGVITPQNPSYKETGAFGKFGLRRSDAVSIINKFKGLSKTHPNFILMDANNMSDHDYTNEMASDKDHLAAKGAELLTARLDSLIRTLNIEP